MKRLGIFVGLALLAPVGWAVEASTSTWPGPERSDDATRQVAAPVPQPPVPASSERLLANDPQRRPHAIAEALVADIRRVPPGEQIDVTTYWLESDRIADALVLAHRRGAVVHVTVDPERRSWTPEAHRLVREFARTPGDGSWFRRDKRFPGGPIVHEKTFRFSRTGADRWVVVTGSWNAADQADRTTWGTMWRVAGHHDIYDTYAAESLADTPRSAAARWHAGRGWAAYFMPFVPALTPGDHRADPVIRILRTVPARRGSSVRIAMFSMWDTRGAWITDELTRLARAGVSVQLVAGPTVSEPLRQRLRQAGATVVSGCFPDGTYVHLKDMALRYVVHGRVRTWTWVGSDNWVTNGLASSQAVLGLAGKDAYEQFAAAYRPLLRRTDGVSEAACRPRDT
jgi:hypothetical protein